MDMVKIGTSLGVFFFFTLKDFGSDSWLVERSED